MGVSQPRFLSGDLGEKQNQVFNLCPTYQPRSAHLSALLSWTGSSSNKRGGRRIA